MTTDKKPDIELSSLREIAGKATDGPWRVSIDSLGVVDIEDPDGMEVAEIGHLKGDVHDLAIRDDAKHIAAFDPPTALAMLDRIEEQDKQLAEYRERAERAEGKLIAIRVQHRRIGTQARSFCVQCDEAWPCWTVKALEGDTSE